MNLKGCPDKEDVIMTDKGIKKDIRQITGNSNIGGRKAAGKTRKNIVGSKKMKLLIKGALAYSVIKAHKDKKMMKRYKALEHDLHVIDARTKTGSLDLFSSFEKILFEMRKEKLERKVERIKERNERMRRLGNSISAAGRSFIEMSKLSYQRESADKLSGVKGDTKLDSFIPQNDADIERADEEASLG